MLHKQTAVVTWEGLNIHRRNMGMMVRSTRVLTQLHFGSRE